MTGDSKNWDFEYQNGFALISWKCTDNNHKTEHLEHSSTSIPIH